MIFYLKEIIKKIWDYLFEIFVWSIFLWMGALSIACTYIFPKEGVLFIVSAIALTFVPRIYENYKKRREE